MDALRIGLAVKVRGKTGVIKYVGKTQFAPGTWVGVELIEPSGKNNGSLNGVEYFKCSKPGNYGIFVSPALIEVLASGNSSSSSPVRSPLRSQSPQQDGDSGKVRHYKSIIDRLQSKLQESFKDIKQYKNQIEQLSKKLDDVDPLQSKIDELQVDRDYFKQENDQLRTNLQSLQTKNDLLIKQGEDLKKELDSNKQIEKEIHSSISLDFANDDLETLVSKNKALQVALQKLKNISMDKELALLSELDELHSKLNNGITKEMYHEVTKKLLQSEETIQDLKSQLDSIDDSDRIINHLTTENDQLNSKIELLQAQLVELAELQQIDKDLEEGHVQIENNLRQTIDNLQQKIIEETKKREGLQFKLNDVNNKLSAVDPGESKNSNISSDEKVLKLTKLDLSAKIRELRYSNLLLEISSCKLEILESKSSGNETILSVNSLGPILQMVMEFIEQSETFGVRFKLKQSFYNIKVVSLVGLQLLGDNKSNHRQLIGNLNNIIDDLLLRIKNHTLVEYKPEPILSLIERLFHTFVSNSAYNRSVLSFLTYETKIVNNFLTYIKPFNVNTESLHGILNKVSERLESLELDFKEVNERYNHNIDKQTFAVSKLIKLCNGNFDFDKLEEVLAQDHEKFVGVIDDICSTFQTYLNDLDLEFTPAIEKTDEDERQVKKEEISVQSVTNQIIEKDKTIKDLGIAIELLKNNLKTSSKNYQSKLDGVISELDAIKTSYNALKEDYNNSIKENQYLRSEIDNLLSTGKYFDSVFTTGKFDSINLETSFNDNIKLIEENNYLKKIIKKKLGSRHSELDQGLEWLESPTRDDTHHNVRRRIDQFERISLHLQKISNSSEQFQLPLNSWQPKSKNPKFILGAIKEQYYKYESDCNTWLSS